MRDLIGIRLVLTIAGVLAGVAFTLVAGYDSVLVMGAAAAGFALLLGSLQLLFGVALQGELRFGWITVTELLRQALVVAMHHRARGGEWRSRPVLPRPDPRLRPHARAHGVACAPRDAAAAGLSPAALVAAAAAHRRLRDRRGAELGLLPHRHTGAVAAGQRARDRLLRDGVPRGGGSHRRARADHRGRLPDPHARRARRHKSARQCRLAPGGGGTDPRHLDDARPVPGGGADHRRAGRAISSIRAFRCCASRASR